MQDAILAEGIQQLCDDLGVEPEDIVMLVISWHLQAAAMGEYSREEFIQVHLQSAFSIGFFNRLASNYIEGCAYWHCSFLCV